MRLTERELRRYSRQMVFDPIGKRDRLKKDEWRESDRRHTELVRERYKQLGFNPPRNILHAVMINNEDLQITVETIQKFSNELGRKAN